MDLIRMKVADLVPYDNNPRINKNAVEAVKESIRQCTYVAPIIVDEDNVILAGHTRRLALIDLKIEEAEVLVAKGLTEQQKKKYRLLDNKTNEFAEWDMEKLLEEIQDIDFGGFDFDFNLDQINEENEKSEEWFEMKEKHSTGEINDDEYNEWLSKFEQKHTTDDCFTPPLVYDAVSDYVAKTYKLNPENFVRPFRPGGDYQKFTYKNSDIVVDNPPFSICAEIYRFYTEKGIPFFLFCSALTPLTTVPGVAIHACGATITYENGAKIATSFATNLDGDSLIITADHELYKAIEEADKLTQKENKKQQAINEYPVNVVTAAMVNRYAKFGADFKLARESAVMISALDSQKEKGAAIFGRGFLVSEKAAAEKAAAEKAAAEKAAAEKAAAEKAAAEKWQLSDREIEIVRGLL